MKAGEISLQHSISFNLDQLIPFIKEGTVEIAEGLFIVRSAYRKTNLELPINMLDEAKQLAEKESYHEPVGRAGYSTSSTDGRILERKDLLQLLKNNIGIHDYEFKTVNIETCL
ncbi:hypothetical protein ACT7DA_20045 [Bacillus pacificus]